MLVQMSHPITFTYLIWIFECPEAFISLTFNKYAVLSMVKSDLRAFHIKNALSMSIYLTIFVKYRN